MKQVFDYENAALDLDLREHGCVATAVKARAKETAFASTGVKHEVVSCSLEMCDDGRQKFFLKLEPVK